MESKRDTQIRFLVENYYDLQKLRIEAFNRVVAYVKSHITGETQGKGAKSLNNLETQSADASHIKIENHEHDAKSQVQNEIHINNASHKANENQCRGASHLECENQKGIAKEVKPSVIAHKIIRQHIEVPKDISDLVWYHNSLYETEKQLAKRLDAWSSHHPLRINFLSRIYGIGPILSSGLIALISPISRFNTPSKLWAYAGLSAEHWQCECKKGHKFLINREVTSCPVRVLATRETCGAEIKKIEHINKPIRRKRGYLLFINPRLRTLMWKVASSFEKQKAEKSRYRRVYQTQKQKYLNREDLASAIKKKEKGAKLHVRLMAMRYVAKRFLRELWVFWRKMEGLPVTEPYSHAVLGHSGYDEWEPDKP